MKSNKEIIKKEALRINESIKEKIKSVEDINNRLKELSKNKGKKVAAEAEKLKNEKDKINSEIEELKGKQWEFDRIIKPRKRELTEKEQLKQLRNDVSRLEGKLESFGEVKEVTKEERSENVNHYTNNNIKPASRKSVNDEYEAKKKGLFKIDQISAVKERLNTYNNRCNDEIVRLKEENQTLANEREQLFAEENADANALEEVLNAISNVDVRRQKRLLKKEKAIDKAKEEKNKILEQKAKLEKELEEKKKEEENIQNEIIEIQAREKNAKTKEEKAEIRNELNEKQVKLGDVINAQGELQKEKLNFDTRIETADQNIAKAELEFKNAGNDAQEKKYAREEKKYQKELDKIYNEIEVKIDSRRARIHEINDKIYENINKLSLLDDEKNNINTKMNWCDLAISNVLAEREWDNAKVKNEKKLRFVDKNAQLPRMIPEKFDENGRLVSSMRTKTLQEIIADASEFPEMKTYVELATKTSSEEPEYEEPEGEELEGEEPEYEELEGEEPQGEEPEGEEPQGEEPQRKEQNYNDPYANIDYSKKMNDEEIGLLMRKAWWKGYNKEDCKILMDVLPRLVEVDRKENKKGDIVAYIDPENPEGRPFIVNERTLQFSYFEDDEIVEGYVPGSMNIPGRNTIPGMMPQQELAANVYKALNEDDQAEKDAEHEKALRDGIKAHDERNEEEAKKTHLNPGDEAVKDINESEAMRMEAAGHKARNEVMNTIERIKAEQEEASKKEEEQALTKPLVTAKEKHKFLSNNFIGRAIYKLFFAGKDEAIEKEREELRQKAEEEARMKAARIRAEKEEAWRRAQQEKEKEARIKAEQEAEKRRKAEEKEAIKKAEEAEQRKKDEELRQKAEEEKARIKAEALARQKAAEEAQNAYRYKVLNPENALDEELLNSNSNSWKETLKFVQDKGMDEVNTELETERQMEKEEELMQEKNKAHIHDDVDNADVELNDADAELNEADRKLQEALEAKQRAEQKKENAIKKKENAMQEYQQKSKELGEKLEEQRNERKAKNFRRQEDDER